MLPFYLHQASKASNGGRRVRILATQAVRQLKLPINRLFQIHQAEMISPTTNKACKKQSSCKLKPQWLVNKSIKSITTSAPALRSDYPRTEGEVRQRDLDEGKWPLQIQLAWAVISSSGCPVLHSNQPSE